MNSQYQKDCHYYHTVGCTSKNCSFRHDGYPKGRCPSQCKNCSAVYDYDIVFNKSNSFYRLDNIAYCNVKKKFSKNQGNRQGNQYQMNRRNQQEEFNSINQQLKNAQQHMIENFPGTKTLSNARGHSYLNDKDPNRRSNSEIDEESEARDFFRKRLDKMVGSFDCLSDPDPQVLWELRQEGQRVALQQLNDPKNLLRYFVREPPKSRVETLLTQELDNFSPNDFFDNHSFFAKIKPGYSDDCFDKFLKSNEKVRDREMFYQDFRNIYDDPRKVEEAERNALERVRNLKGEYKSIDLVFLMDCTESMQPYIKMVKEQIINIIKKTKALVLEDMYLRVGIVGYRDFDYPDSRLETFHFGTAEKACEFLAKIEAKHGGGPEDVNGGMQKALKLEWSKPENGVIRFLVHIGDAPCHNQKYHYLEDNFPEGHEEDRDFKELFAEMKIKKINYLFLKIKMITDKMVEAFRKLYENPALPNTGTLFRTEEINSFDTELFCNIISSLLSNSLASLPSMILLKGSTVSTKNYDLYEHYNIVQKAKKKFETIQKNILDNNHDFASKSKSPAAEVWKTSIFHSKILFSNNLDTFLESPNKDLKIISQDLRAKIQSIPFVRGFSSLVHRCKVNVAKDKKDELIQNYDEFDMVVKKPISNKVKNIWQQLRKNVLAVTLANLFNEYLEEAEASSEERIYFSRIIQINDQEQFYVTEGYIDGTFTRYTGNSTFVDETYPLMTAFSHFSYVVTQGKYMVTDLKGSNNILTNPTIHSRLIEFEAENDRSFDGMMAFFIDHKCNQYCQRLNLPHHFAQGEPRKMSKVFPNKIIFKTKCNNPFCNKSLHGVYNTICESCTAKKVDLNKMMEKVTNFDNYKKRF